MAGTITTAFCDSARQELMQSLHDFEVTSGTIAVTNSSGSVSMTGIAATQIVNFRVGSLVTGTNITGSAVVVSIDGTNAISISKTTAAAVTQVTVTADTFYMLLLKSTSVISQNYDRALNNVGTPGTGTPAATNVGTDEIANGSGYTSNGQSVTNTTVGLTASQGAYWSPNGNISWSSATFTAGGAVLYNTRARKGHANGIAANATGSAINKSISVHSFSGDKAVSSGTFTVVMPAYATSTALLYIS